MVTVTNTAYINAWSIVELFRELRKIHIEGPITVILDNAKYQRCYVAERAAHMFNIELLFLPPYSPNLNLIERAWKFVKKKALNNQSFKSFQLFQEAICDCIGKFSSDYGEELDTLLTWNFQVL
jgi:transposase